VQPEVGEAPILEVIKEARTSIRVMVFQLGPSGVLDALAAKARAGVKVRVILDGSRLSHNDNNVPLIQERGCEVRWGNPAFEFTHAKVIVADDAAAVISTGNYVLGQVKADRNFVAVDRDPEDVAALGALFDADWSRRPLDAHCERLVVSPDNARGRILRLIESAERTLDVESMELGDGSVRHALADRRAAGVRVRVVLADPWWVRANDAAARYLAANRIRARYLVSPSVHAKAIVADGARAYVGSVNLSWTSLTRNREIGVIADEPGAVATISATLARDWSRAITFALPANPRA